MKNASKPPRADLLSGDEMLIIELHFKKDTTDTPWRYINLWINRHLRASYSFDAKTWSRS